MEFSTKRLLWNPQGSRIFNLDNINVLENITFLCFNFPNEQAFLERV